ncbi:MAG: hypothetical protein SGI89_10910 [bacterium]|nr:hypothetical protein [bacterium]
MKIIYLSLFVIAILISLNQETVSNVSSKLSDTTEYCLVSGEKIDGEGVKYSYLNTEVKFCCESCEKSFKKNPAKYLSASGLRCSVCDEDDAKKEISEVTKGVKYYFCGKGCKAKFSEDPQAQLKKYQK